MRIGRGVAEGSRSYSSASSGDIIPALLLVEEVVGDDFRIGSWLVQPSLNTVSQNGKIFHIEPKVMEVLVCLARHAGETLSKQNTAPNRVAQYVCHR